MKKYYSQYRQDEFLNTVIFPNKKSGFYLDIGAHDGIIFSNTYFFEKTKNWMGICFEPNPKVFKLLEKNRKSYNYNICVGNYDGEVTFCQVEGYAEMLSGIKDFYDQRHINRIGNEIALNGGNINNIPVPIKQLTSINEIIDQKIDFVSIDTEGNELSILNSIDFNRIYISAITVENNYKDPFIYDFLKSKSYERIIRLGEDEIYLKSELVTIGLIARTFYWKFLNRIKSLMIRK